MSFLVSHGIFHKDTQISKTGKYYRNISIISRRIVSQSVNYFGKIILVIYIYNSQQNGVLELRRIIE